MADSSDVASRCVVDPSRRSATSVDLGRTAADYAACRAGFPDEFFSRLRAMGVGLAGQRIVDLGTGILARGLADRDRRAAGALTLTGRRRPRKPI